MNKKAGIVILVQLISIIIAALLLFGVFLCGIAPMSNMLMYLCDFGTLALLLVMILPPMLIHGVWRDFFRVFLLGKRNRKFSICEIKKTLLAIELLQKQIIYGTVMIVCIHAMVMLMNLDAINALGPNIAVVIGSILYMAIALLFIEPLKAYTQRYLEDYLAEEED